MTLEERIAKVNEAVEKKAKEEKEKNEKEFGEMMSLISQCNEYSERVRDLLKLARYCIEKGIRIPIKGRLDTDNFGTAKKYGYPHEFFAEGICHHVGFIAKDRYAKKPEIIAIGIVNGGCCGVWDFYNTGDDIYSKHEENGSIMSPKKKDMQQFLKEFESFEKAFYNFIDSL